MSPQAPSQELPVRYLKGVGPKRALALERLGVQSVRDLFYFVPKRYEDRSRFCKIAAITPGETATLRGEILSVDLKPLRRMTLIEMVAADESASIPAIWFNQPYLKNQFEVGREVILFGKAEWRQNRIQLVSPEYELTEKGEESIHTGRITPVYPLTEGLFQRSLRSTIKEAIENELEKTILDPLPDSFRASRKLMGLCPAIREMHFPSSFENQELARQRLVWDEFFVFELLLLKQIRDLKLKSHALTLKGAEDCLEIFRKSLNFSLTKGQERAMHEIGQDVSKTLPMNRLLQGDVGAGKTLVAAFALLLAAKNDCQSALLVPTEILAEQHARTLPRLFKPFSVSVGLLTASVPDAKRSRLLANLRQKKISVLVGTHALFQEDVRFASLALVVTDEQHKFGVHQRCRLLHSDPRPHQLVMTATPIPRTLALTTYGNLDVSAIPELPGGRQPIKTYWIHRKKQPEILEHILQKVRAGEKAYFIFPIIEESEKSDLFAATEEYDRLRKGIFREVRVGLVHGRLPLDERDRTMQAFRTGEIRILVATSVVEVGLDDPHATVMVIENAERFGLSQLHQMRGRIGRGTKPSECFLFGEPKTLEGQKRLRILTKTQDGFVIAEEDLKLRGPGDVWGTRQSGDPLFRIADPLRDYKTLLEARDMAQRLIQKGELERSTEWIKLKQFLEKQPLNF